MRCVALDLDFDSDEIGRPRQSSSLIRNWVSTPDHLFVMDNSTEKKSRFHCEGDVEIAIRGTWPTIYVK